MNKDQTKRVHDIADVRIEIEEELAAPREEGIPALRGPRGRWLIAAALLIVAGAMAIRLRPMVSVPASYTQLTFRRGTISSARFAPDGQTVVYSAAWNGGPNELYSMRIGSHEARSLGIQGHLLSISRHDEMAVRLGSAIVPGEPGTLAQVSLSGGVPRELLSPVVVAEWDLEAATLPSSAT